MLSDLMALPPQAATVAFPRGRLTLRAMPASAGIEIAESASYNWDGMRRGLTPFVVIQHTLAGAGGLTYEGRDMPLEPGDTLVVAIPHAHRYFLPPGGRWSFFYLVLQGQEVLRLIGEVIAVAGPVLRLSARNLDRLAGAVTDLIGGRARTPGEASAIAYSAAMALVDDLSGAAAADGGGTQPAWLARVRGFVEAQPGAALTVARLAAVAGLSRAHFVRQFTRATGAPPSEYVFRSRMARAARLLQSSRLPVAEIATGVGFADPNYFAKAFRRAFDVSPTEFRRSGLYTAG
jgi:AraC-like DNA-binding protein